ncbi:peroxiredoxin [Rubrivivax gelatinosus]|uniref:Glutathione-dependent peroxiredoxin n=1 Tax=Rubrivivax gelatinosus (strain NBRC 100245 / IL144) TaxID=983917 RepID=I0HKZ7_RUBGI|nr:peroxiredoxin [Rubrivivax gelatinosus]MBG6080304.1 peroxiredoxin [Rubrivivax gelatinosus]BAL93684.1 peroxiredoxin-2E-1 like protein [Rubrivivax gelatinosus IL144]
MLKIGDRLPAGQLHEYVDVATEGCALGPNAVDIGSATAGKTIVVFGLPGAFTPTCSERHVPGYVAKAAELRAAGVDEVWCVSVNDAFVMGAWGRQLGVQGSVRMMGDGNADFARATGLTLDLTSRGMGLRSARYAMIVVDGVVHTLAVEAAGKFEVSDAETVLQQLRSGVLQ